MNLGKKLLLLVTSSLTVLAGAVMAPALPSIMKEFILHENAEILTKMILTFPALGVVIGAPLAGFLTDKVGRKINLISGLLIYAVAGTSAAFLNSLETILIGRFILGIGTAFVMVASTTIITDLTKGNERSKLLGMQASFMAASGIVYLNAGGITTEISWRIPTVIHIIALFIIPFAYKLIEGDSKLRLGQKLKESPPAYLIPLYIIGMIGMLLFYLGPVQIPFLLAQNFNGSGKQIGLLLSVMTISSSILSLLYNKFKESLGVERILILTFAMMAPGILIIGIAKTWLTLLIGVILFGAGIGTLMPNLSFWVSSKVKMEQRGRALGHLSTGFFLGQFLSPIFVLPIISIGFPINKVFVISGIFAFLIVALLIAMKRFNILPKA